MTRPTVHDKIKKNLLQTQSQPAINKTVIQNTVNTPLNTVSHKTVTTCPATKSSVIRIASSSVNNVTQRPAIPVELNNATYNYATRLATHSGVTQNSGKSSILFVKTKILFKNNVFNIIYMRIIKY